MKNTIPQEIKKEYPFTGKYFTLGREKMHYIDEGEGDVIVMLHGNPTWSFFYRNLIKQMSRRYRVIAPDHIGCGLSSKPQNYDYTLEQHILNVKALMKHLDVDKYHLVVHDWGGAIGFGMAVDDPEKLLSATVMNTAAFRSGDIPFRINICRTPFIGERFVRAFNGFAWPATFMAVKRTMSPDVKKGYLLPYDSYANRIATARFVLDIPLKEDHPSYNTLALIESRLKDIKAPLMILWGEKDFCFTTRFRDRWSEFFPDARVKTYGNAGHYLLEDEKDDVILCIDEFINEQNRIYQ